MTGPCHYRGVCYLLSCSWDLTRAFYNLFLYNTRAGRLKSSTRREAGLGLAATSLPPVYIFLGKRPLTATHAAHEWLCRSSEARRGKSTGRSRHRSPGLKTRARMLLLSFNSTKLRGCVSRNNGFRRDHINSELLAGCERERTPRKAERIRGKSKL